MKAINSIPVLALAALLALVSYPGQAKADVAGGCYETQRIWKEGYWRVSSRGQVWIPGRWISRQVAVPCPPPVYPAPGGRPVVVRPHDYPPAAPAPSMGPQEYQAVLAQLSRMPFDDSRVATIQQILQHHWLTSQQVQGMLGTLTFERSRLEPAKQAYGRVVDPERYYVVYQLFNSPSYAQELRAHIQAYPHP